MNSISRILIALAALACAAPALAVSNHSATAPESGKAATRESFRVAPGSIAARGVSLGVLDEARVLAVKSANAASWNKRLQIGIGRDVPPAWEASSHGLDWASVDGGLAAHWEVSSTGARALRIGLVALRLPTGTEVRFAGEGAPDTVYGPFIETDFAAMGATFWSPVLEGEGAIVEIFVPQGASPYDGVVVLSQVSHLFASPSQADVETLAKAAGACEVDLVCRSATDPALASVGKSVARMTFSDGSGGGTFLCTGTLLNPRDGSFKPYFYSANHCIGTQASASTLTTHWFYDRTGCGTGSTSASYVQLAGGATLLYANEPSDALLLRLNANPPSGAVFAGWEQATLATGTPLTGVHHPAGDLKKVSLAVAGGFGSPGSPSGSFIRANWNSTATGVTEGGSSGSGIFTAVGQPAADYRFRGGLWGGPSSCSASAGNLYDYYSRFDQVYPSIAQYLNPAPTVCTYTLTPASQSLGDSAATGFVTVSTTSTCAWTATSNASWITTTSSGSGGGTASYSVQANTGASPRSGTLTIAGQAFTVTQAAPAFFVLAVARSGTGSGTVVSSPTGINCGVACTANVANGATVSLTASAAAGSIFAGWSGGDCGGIGTCATTMGGAATVIATFLLPAAVPTPLASPASVDFGGQSMNTTAPAKQVSILNVGTGTITVNNVFLTGNQFAQSNNCTTIVAGASCTVSVNFTPIVQGGVSGSLTVATNAGTLSVPLAGSGELSLVTHYYRSILRRAPDAGGKAFWDGEATRVQALGANVNEVWYAMAGSFYFSSEYAAFSRDNAGFVTDLYGTFFNRAPDAAGFNDWMGQLSAGMPREVVLASFMFSPEFVSFTQAIFGTATVRKEIDVVGDFYRGLLARLPDDGGFNFWVQQFRVAQCSGSAAVTAQAESISSQFALGSEYAARARTNSQYVGDLYNAFLRRGGELAGVQFWIDQIATGARTRENVRQAFVGSAEFSARVAIVTAQGCL